MVSKGKQQYSVSGAVLKGITTTALKYLKSGNLHFVSSSMAISFVKGIMVVLFIKTEIPNQR